jgi:hypothetical protein
MLRTSPAKLRWLRFANSRKAVSSSSDSPEMPIFAGFAGVVLRVRFICIAILWGVYPTPAIQMFYKYKKSLNLHCARSATALRHEQSGID